MATHNQSLNHVFADAELEVGKVLIMSSNHDIALENIERLTRSTLTELDFQSCTRDRFLNFVVHNSMAAINQDTESWFEIYLIDGANACSTYLRAAEPDKFIAAFEVDAAELKRLHNASLSHKQVNSTRSALLNAKNAHNELVALSKKSKAFSCFTTRTSALNAASHSYGVQTLKKLKKDIKLCMSKTW